MATPRNRNLVSFETLTPYKSSNLTKCDVVKNLLNRLFSHTCCKIVNLVTRWAYKIYGGQQSSSWRENENLVENIRQIGRKIYCNKIWKGISKITVRKRFVHLHLCIQNLQTWRLILIRFKLLLHITFNIFVSKMIKSIFLKNVLSWNRIADD